MKLFRDGMNLVVLSCENEEERAWLEENTEAEPYLWMGRWSLAVDIRMAGPIIRAAARRGFFALAEQEE